MPCNLLFTGRRHSVTYKFQLMLQFYKNSIISFKLFLPFYFWNNQPCWNCNKKSQFISADRSWNQYFYNWGTKKTVVLYHSSLLLFCLPLARYSGMESWYIVNVTSEEVLGHQPLNKCILYIWLCIHLRWTCWCILICNVSWLHKSLFQISTKLALIVTLRSQCFL